MMNWRMIILVLYFLLGTVVGTLLELDWMTGKYWFLWRQFVSRIRAHKLPGICYNRGMSNFSYLLFSYSDMASISNSG